MLKLSSIESSEHELKAFYEQLRAAHVTPAWIAGGVMDRRVIVETSGECFPIVTVSCISPTDKQAGDLMLVFYQRRQIIVDHS